MKTDISVTFEPQDIKALCVVKYVEKYGCPQGMEARAEMKSYGQDCVVTLVEIEDPEIEETPDNE